MARKTERLFASASLVGDDKGHAAMSFATALTNLEVEAKKQGREVLFDTLEVGIERDVRDERTITGGHLNVSTYAIITVSAEAVKVSETTTEHKE